MTAAPLILVVEDEPRIAEVILAYLHHAGLAAHHLERGDEVASYIQASPPALLVLDLMLPGLDGISVCRKVRETHPALPIIIVTAKIEEIDRLLGFESGADDYLCKPFSPRELVFRVQALLRRSGALAPTTNTLLFRHEASSQRVFCGGQLLSITPQEYRLLVVMMAAPGRIFSRAQLLELAYREGGEVFDRTVDSHIKNLRKKLAVPLGEREVIHSVYGVGYRFEID